MQQLSNILPAAMSSVVLQKERPLGSTTMVGNTNLTPIRANPLTADQLMAIQSRVLRQPLSIKYGERKIYGRKRVSDEFGEYYLENQPIGTEVAVDCVVDVLPNAPDAMLQSALMLSPKEAYAKHFAHLMLHKKFGSTDQDRAVMMADYIQVLQAFPEFIVYSILKHYWENDKRPFVPYIAEIREACDLVQKSLSRAHAAAKEPLKIVKQESPKPEPAKELTAEEKSEESAKIHALVEQALKNCSEGNDFKWGKRA